ncbi:MAG: hypothetical protein Q8867_05360 [Bacteroidota bacterium]|nr:hypothetical protein [Bacteroidota bacterium]
MKNLSFKKVIPYVAAILIFLVITMVFLSPLIEGKRLYQSDIVQFKGMSKEIVDFRARTGQEPLWTNSMFGGMPAYQISTVYKANLIGYLDNILTLGLPHPANLVFLYFLGFFILLLAMGVNPWLAIAGSIAYAFSSFFFIVIDVGHNSQAHAIGYIAFALAGIILAFRKKYIAGGILTALFLSLELKANHPQITYYFVLLAVILGIFILVQSIREKDFGSFMKSVGVIFVAGIFALLTNITSLWATNEYGKYTIRGKTELTSEKENRTSGLDKSYATQWSYGIGETMTLMIPDFYGGSSSGKLGENSATAKALRQNNVPDENIKQFIHQPVPPLYWGDQPFVEGPVYVGAIIVFLFLLGLFIVKGPVKWWLLGATALSIALAWGHNFMALTDFFLMYVPGYNKFRSVSMILVIAEIAMPLLGILALKEIFDKKQDKKKLFKYLKISFYIAGGLTLIFAVIPGMFLNFSGPSDSQYAHQYQIPDWLIQAIRDDRIRLERLDALRSFIFITLTALLIWGFLYEKVKKEYAYVALIVLFLVDMFPVNKRYLNNDSFTSKSQSENPIEPSRADQMILQDKDPDFRVLNVMVNPFQDATTSYFHKSIGGYHGAKLRRYQELIDNQISKNNMAVLNMLNTKYIITAGGDRNPVAQMNPEAAGHAWFVKAYKIVPNADAELNSLTHFNPKDTAIIDARYQGQLAQFQSGRDSLDNIQLDSYAPNDLKYTYSSKSNGLAVFSEIYYPKGWNAYIDGKLTPHFCSDYVLRAMVLPAGNHKVEFRFEPKVYFVGEKISLYSSILLILLVLGFGGWELQKVLRKRS